MTVSTNLNKVKFDGDDSTTVFPLGGTFIFFDSSELQVYIVDETTEVQTLQTITTDYTVSGGSGSTGTVTMVVAPTSDEQLLVLRVMPITQTADLINNDTQDSEVVETALDKNCLSIQQLDEELFRSLKIPSAETTEMEIPSATNRRGKILGFDDDATAAPRAVTAGDPNLVVLEDVLVAMNQADIVPAADKLVYLTGAADADITDLTSFARTILDDANAGAVRTTLSVPNIAGDTFTGAMIHTNEGMKIFDTGGDHSLILKPNEDLTADRILNVVVSDAARTLTLGANLTVSADQTLAGNASQAEAEAGSENTKMMTALRVSQAIDALGSGLNFETAQATTSGTAFDFTGLPGGVSRVVVIFDGVSLSGTDEFLVQLGTSAGFTTTGYVASSHTSGSGGGASVNSTSGFISYSNNAARLSMSIMEIINISGNTWVASHAGRIGDAIGLNGGGNVTLASTLTQVRITRTGSNTFDLGQVNIAYQ